MGDEIKKNPITFEMREAINETAIAVEKRIEATIKPILDNSLKPIYDLEKEKMKAELADVKKTNIELFEFIGKINRSYLGVFVINRIQSREERQKQKQLKKESKNEKRNNREKNPIR